MLLFVLAHERLLLRIPFAHFKGGADGIAESGPLKGAHLTGAGLALVESGEPSSRVFLRVLEFPRMQSS